MLNHTIDSFLLAPTPASWLEVALSQVPFILVDHAHCEKKAASNALSLMYRYTQYPDLLQKMSKLAREELRHFEQVLTTIRHRGETYHHIAPGGYANTLHRQVTNHEPNKLIDTLIVGAFIEARSCERFKVLSTLLEPDLALFYSKLHRAEERHFLTYVELARSYALEDIEPRIKFFAEIEADYITQKDENFRFHSGVP